MGFQTLNHSLTTVAEALSSGAGYILQDDFFFLVERLNNKIWLPQNMKQNNNDQYVNRGRVVCRVWWIKPPALGGGVSLLSVLATWEYIVTRCFTWCKRVIRWTTTAADYGRLNKKIGHLGLSDDCTTIKKFALSSVTNFYRISRWEST